MPIVPIEKPFANKRKGVAPGFSSWEIALDEDIRRSWVLQLPDELLLEIMHATAIDDLYMLRQVSSTFWRLYQGREFDKFCRQLTRARRNAFCGPCSEVLESGKHKARLAKLREKIFCPSCKGQHSRWQFSPAQHSSPDATRKCIISNGFIRLCRHRTVSLKSFKTLCFYPNGRTRLENLGNYIIERCHECHSQAFHSGWDGRRSELAPPSLRVVTNDWKPQHSVRLSLSWAVPLFRISEDALVTMADIQRALEEVESKYGVTTCPHFNFNDGQLLRMLDSLVCICFDNDNHLWSHEMHNSEYYKQIQTSCRKDAMIKRRPYGNQFESELRGSCNHSMRCGLCGTAYSLTRNGGHVFLHRDTNADVTVYEGKTHWWSQLVSVLETSSHLKGCDDETKHLIWCDEKSCRNGDHWNTSFM
ncbi:hypothetical protein CcaCcLH18_05269 [Colletotrichum camelliae]|nr:hypothetical protein CcaCcLH18_05269 [Colletotrichum camelliae]